MLNFIVLLTRSCCLYHFNVTEPVFITGGNVYDSTQAEKLHNTIHEGVYVIGDKAFDSEQIIKYIEKNRVICVMTPRKNRKEQRKYHK
ncbi:MAG: transposase, partial [Clostridia bacterium]